MSIPAGEVKIGGSADSSVDPLERFNSESLLSDIRDRLSRVVNTKVKEKVQSVVLPRYSHLGEDLTSFRLWLCGIRNDFYRLVENPNDECGGGQYDGWSAQDIKGLYYVLYGEQLDEATF